MDNLALAQELDNVVYVGVIGEPEDVIISYSRLLLRGKVLGGKSRFDIELLRNGEAVSRDKLTKVVSTALERLSAVGNKGELAVLFRDDPYELCRG